MSTRQIDQFMRWNSRTRQYSMVLWRREVLPSWLTIRDIDSLQPLVVAAAPAQGTPLTIFQPYSSVNGADAGFGTPFEVRSIVFEDSVDGTAAANFTVSLNEVGEVRTFMNAPVHIRTLAGTGQLPAILREPYMFLSQHNISAKFTKVAGGASAMRFYLVGAQYFPWSPMMIQYPNEKRELTGLLSKWMNRRKYVWPFWLTTEAPGQLNGGIQIPAGVGSVFETTVKIGDANHFESFGHAAVSDQGNNTFALEVREVKTNQSLMNGQISQANGIGNSSLPTVYPTSYLMPAGYRMRLRFTNLVAGVNNVWFTWFGRMINAPISQVQEVLRDTAVPTPADSPSLMVPRPLTGMRGLRR